MNDSGLNNNIGNNLKDDLSNHNTYRATRNLNTAMETPEFNVNDTFEVNIKDSSNNMELNNNNQVVSGGANKDGSRSSSLGSLPKNVSSDNKKSTKFSILIDLRVLIGALVMLLLFIILMLFIFLK